MGILVLGLGVELLAGEEDSVAFDALVGEDFGVPAGEVGYFGGAVTGRGVAAEGGGELADEVDVGVGVDLVFEAYCPEDGVDEGAPVAFVDDAWGGTVDAAEGFAFGAAFVAVGTCPGCGHGGFAFEGGGAGAEAVEGLGHGEDFAFVAEVRTVAAFVSPGIFDAEIDGVVLLFGDDVQADALGMVAAVVAAVFGPAEAEDLLAEAVGEVFALVVVGEFEVGAFVVLDAEGMRGGSEPDDRAATFEVSDEVLHLAFVPVLEAEEEEHEVGVLEGFHAGDVV